MRYIIAFLFVVLTTGCANFGISGQTSGGDRGGNVDFSLKTRLSDRFYFKSRVSQPYEYEQPIYRIPPYTENGLEFNF